MTGASFLTSSEQFPVIFIKLGPWLSWQYDSTGRGLELFSKTVIMADWQYRYVFRVITLCMYVLIYLLLTSVFQAFQEEIQGKGVCLDFIQTVRRETIMSDARRATLTIQASTARVILIFCWYTDVKELFLELAKRNVSYENGHLHRLWTCFL